MGILIITCLAGMILLFLTTIAIQAIKLEKKLTEISNYAELKLGQIYLED